jgi:hypothetical protein
VKKAKAWHMVAGVFVGFSCFMLGVFSIGGTLGVGHIAGLVVVLIFALTFSDVTP